MPEAQGRAEYMAALVLRTTSLDRAEAALAQGRIAHLRDPHRIVVPPGQAMGATLVFHP